MRIQKNLIDLTERYESDDDESEKHLDARDRRYLCLTFRHQHQHPGFESLRGCHSSILPKFYTFFKGQMRKVSNQLH